jgi:hypothetical protein
MTSKDITMRLKGFTPLMDALIDEFDITTAAVWGRVWRYTQGEKGICYASLETLAEELGLNKRTIIRKLSILTATGYLNDDTPNLKNRPHTYSLTTKATLMGTIEGVTLSHSTVTESHRESDSESLEDTSKIQLKKQVKKDSQQMQESSRIIQEEAVIPIIEEEQDKPFDTTPEAIRAIQEVAHKYPNRIVGARRPAGQVISSGAKLDYDIKEDFYQFFRINIVWESKSGRELLKWLKERPPDQTLGMFSSWWKTQDWRGKQGQPPSVNQVMELWPQAFLNGANKQSRASETF